MVMGIDHLREHAWGAASPSLQIQLQLRRSAWSGRRQVVGW